MSRRVRIRFSFDVDVPTEVPLSSVHRAIRKSMRTNENVLTFAARGRAAKGHNVRAEIVHGEHGGTS